jgi:hypothetical protein
MKKPTGEQIGAGCGCLVLSIGTITSLAVTGLLIMALIKFVFG